jgi:hypothetical protein
LYNIAGKVKPYYACGSDNSGAPSLVTAAGTGDNSKVTGTTIDRKGTDVGSMAQSCELAIAWKTALTDTKTLSLAVEYQTSADNSSWDTAVVMQAATVVKTATATTNYVGIEKFTLDLTSLKRYVRFSVTPDLSHTGTDTALFVAVANLVFPNSEDAV